MELSALNWGEGALIFLLSLCAGCGAIWLSGYLARPRPGATPEEAPDTVFVFDGERLIDASPAAARLLAQLPQDGDNRHRLNGWLDMRFAEASVRIGALAPGQTLRIRAKGSPLVLEAEWREQHLRLTLSDGTLPPRERMDRISLHAQEEELALLRKVADRAPLLIWRETRDAAVPWANTAYLDLARTRSGEEEIVWPLPRIFEPLPPLSEVEDPAEPTRISLPAIDEDIPARWFDTHSIPGEGGSNLRFATPIDALVTAQTTQREFTRTLANTFAELATGLAIFDRQRKLQIFNPALSDLTNIGAELLSTRPSLFTFLDLLRENRMMPERKDYASWRQKMVELEQAAVSGRYEETWSLATGQTYRVSGRPHPEGAVALLIEDISAEISLTRRFRAELELGQEVLDALPQAIAVFGAQGGVTMSNTAYTRLWKTDPGAMLCSPSVRETVRHWQSLSLPNPIWAEVSDYLSAIQPRPPWQAGVTISDGQQLCLRLTSLSAGGTLVSFEAPTPPVRIGELQEALG